MGFPDIIYQVLGLPWAVGTLNQGAIVQGFPHPACGRLWAGVLTLDLIHRVQTRVRLRGIPSLGFGAFLFWAHSWAFVSSVWRVSLEFPLRSAPDPDLGLSRLQPSIWISYLGPVSRFIPVCFRFGGPGILRMFPGSGAGVLGSIPRSIPIPRHRDHRCLSSVSGGHLRIRHWPLQSQGFQPQVPPSPPPPGLLPLPAHQQEALCRPTLLLPV